MDFELATYPATERTHFQSVADAEAALRSGECRRWASQQSEAEGRFSVDKLCSGEYSMQIRTWPALVPRQRYFTVPASGVDVVLEGYLIRLMIVDRDDSPVEHALIEIEFSPDGRFLPSTTVTMSSRTDAAGAAHFGLKEPGSCIVRARHELASSPDTEVDAHGPYRLIERTVALTERTSGSVLRVVLRGSEFPQPTIRDFCCRLKDRQTHEDILFLCSEFADLDGAFRGLPVGEFDLELTPRVMGPASLYVPGGAASKASVVLRESEETQVELSAPLQGRISIEVRVSEGDLAAMRDLRASVAIIDPDGTHSRPLAFREPVVDGVRIAQTIPIGERQLCEQTISPGQYVLEIMGPHLETSRIVVGVFAGEVSEATCTVRRTD